MNPMKIKSNHLLTVLFCGSLAGSPVFGEILSFKFQDSEDVAFAANVSAGAPGFEATNWNFLQTDWSGNADNDAVLSDVRNSAGDSTTSLQAITYGANSDVVHYDANNTWRSGVGNATPDDTLMNGYLDDGQDNQPYVNFSLAPGALENYTVVLYVHGDGVNGPIGQYWIEEWSDPLAEGNVLTDRVAIDQNEWDGTYLQAGNDFIPTLNPTVVTVSSGNYLVFKNLTARNFRIRAAGNGDPEDAGRGPLNAVQILDTIGDPNGDSDNDGLLNAWEESFGLDPNSNQGDDGASGNPDNDGLTNLEEQDRGTNPLLADSDDDGFNDEVETDTGIFVSLSDTGTSPINADTDNDGLPDGSENASGNYLDADNPGTSPLTADTDNDNLPDGWEALNGLDPNDNGSGDPDNGPDGDPDNDSSPNSEELLRGTLPRNDDTDDDGFLDGFETNEGVFVSATETGTDPNNPDTDGDTILDGAETGDGNFVDASSTGTNPLLHDSDDDGYFDEQELARGTDPTDPASRPDFPAPIGFWTFDDQGDATTTDDSGNGNSGTVLGNPTYVAGHSDRPSDFALEFDGIDDVVTTTLGVNGFTSFTLAGWVRAPMGQTGTSGLFGQNDVVEFGYNEPGNLHFWSNPGGAIDSPISPSEEWRHIAITGDTTERALFVNGQKVATGAAASPLGTSGFFVNIGGGTIFNEAGNYFLGQINDVGLWDVALSEKLMLGLADGSLNPLPGLTTRDLEITSLEFEGGQIVFTINNTNPGTPYLMESSPTLLDGSWTTVSDFDGANEASSTTIGLTAASDERLFYRVREETGD